MSAGGVLAEATGLRGPMRVAIDLPGGLGSITADGVVVRAGHGGSAVRFAAIEEGDREFLDRFVLGVRHQLAPRFAAAR